MFENIKKIVIIVGCQRSGTTLIGQLLGAHGNAFLIDEPDGLYEWFHAYINGNPEFQKINQRLLGKAKSKYKQRHQRVIVEKNKKLALSPNITHIILKAPNLTYSYDVISRIPIPVSVIYPVRDPRSVVASMGQLAHIDMVGNQVKWINKQPALAQEFAEDMVFLQDADILIWNKHALIWRIKSSLYERFSDLGTATLMFKYEDFVADTETYARRIADHVGLFFDQKMLEHENVFQGFGPGMTERTRSIDAFSVERWCDQLSLEQIEDVVKVSAGMMKKLGYDSKIKTRIRNAGIHISESQLRSPIILTGRGGSGTRILSEIAENAGIFLGNRLNATRDSTEWVDLIYKMGAHFASGAAGVDVESGGYWEQLLLQKAQDVLGAGVWEPEDAWGWKLPETMTAVPEVMRTFTGAKLIHLVRHPVDSSLRRTHMTSRMDNPIGEAVMKAAYCSIGLDPALAATHEEYMHNAITWLYQVKSVMTFARDNLSNDRYLEIRYEDFYADPVGVQSKISHFVSCDLKFVVPQMDVGRKRSYDFPDPRISEVWELCKDTAIELGYGPIE